jgi:acetyl esterase/lipase
VPAARQALLAMVGQMMASGVVPPPDYTGLKREEIQIPVRDGSTVRAIHIRPDSGSPGPLAVLYHGGGWCIGMAEMEEPQQIMLAKEFGVTSVSVDYRKAPEKTFPVAIEDSWDALKWVSLRSPWNV